MKRQAITFYTDIIFCFPLIVKSDFYGNADFDCLNIIFIIFKLQVLTHKKCVESNQIRLKSYRE